MAAAHKGSAPASAGASLQKPGLRSHDDGAVEDFTRLDDSVRHVVSHRVERGSDVLCRDSRNASEYDRGRVPHCAARNSRVDSYYVITADCITEGKGDVKWMKCSP